MSDHESSEDARLAGYAALVDRCARERLDYPIANGSAVHARILIAKLFEIAESSVEIISGTLRQQTSENVKLYAHEPVVEQARAFLRRPNTALSIIVQKGELDQGDKNLFVKTVADDPHRQGTISIFVPKREILGDEIAHFMVADGAAYRVETGQDAKPSNRGIVAVANFGDLKLAKTLTGYFGQVTKYLLADQRLTQQAHLQPRVSYSLS